MRVALRLDEGQHLPSLAMWDAACGRCHPCQRGLPARCVAPLPVSDDVDRWHARAVGEPAGRAALAYLADAVRAVALLIAWRELRPVVALQGDSRSRDTVAAAIAPLSSLVQRRADVVLALDGDLAQASLAVRRGGAVGSIIEPVSLPTYKAIVQRELEVLAPIDLLEAFTQIDIPRISRIAQATPCEQHGD